MSLIEKQMVRARASPRVGGGSSSRGPLHYKVINPLKNPGYCPAPPTPPIENFTHYDFLKWWDLQSYKKKMHQIIDNFMSYGPLKKPDLLFSLSCRKRGGYK